MYGCIDIHENPYTYIHIYMCVYSPHTNAQNPYLHAYRITSMSVHTDLNHVHAYLHHLILHSLRKYIFRIIQTHTSHIITCSNCTYFDMQSKYKLHTRYFQLLRHNQKSSQTCFGCTGLFLGNSQRVTHRQNPRGFWRLKQWFVG